METLKKVVVSKRAELAARGGHPWIYGTEIEEAERGGGGHRSRRYRPRRVEEGKVHRQRFL